MIGVMASRVGTAALLQRLAPLVVSVVLCCGLVFGAKAETVAEEAGAEEANTEIVESIQEESSLLGGMLGKLDEQHEAWSTRLEGTARRVDAFFGDDRAYEDANETRGQVTVEANKIEGSDTQFDVRVRAKIQLPRTEQKLRLLVESDASELGEEQSASNSPVGALEDTRFSLALETILPVMEKWNVSPAIGIAADWPPDPYVRVRATRYFDLQPWLARFSTTASWYTVAGPIARASLDFDRQLHEAWLFRAATNVKWEKDDDVGENTEASETLILFQDLSGKRSASYSVSANADSDEGWAVHSYGVGIAYRQTVYRDWLFGEVNPYATFERIYEWDETLGMVLRLEALFGP